MSARRLTWVLLALVATTPAAAALIPDVAEGLGPGTHLQVDIDGKTYGCTAAWVYRDAAGERYLSTAGHCLLSPFAVATHGPDADGPSGAHVRACIDRCVFGGQTGFLLSGRTVERGPVAYARQLGFGGAVVNDFGLVLIPRGLDDEVRYGLPEFGEATSMRDVRLGDHMGRAAQMAREAGLVITPVLSG